MRTEEVVGMPDEGEGRGSAIEVLAVVVIAVFAITILFGLFSAITGAIWWAIKLAVLIAVLFFAIRWAWRRSLR
jgi:hypothetical protein